MSLPAPRTPGRYRVAVVCLGNICRSPMAHVVLEDLVRRSGLDDRVEVALLAGVARADRGKQRRGDVEAVAHHRQRLDRLEGLARVDRRRDVAALDTTRVAPHGGTYAWPATPTFVHSANLAAVLLTPNERQIERIQLALEAGPPQPAGGAR